MHRCIMNVEDQEAETVFQEAGGFEVGSTVQVGQPPRYGVVRWLGSFPKGKELLAGIELVRLRQTQSCTHSRPVYVHVRVCVLVANLAL